MRKYLLTSLMMLCALWAQAQKSWREGIGQRLDSLLTDELLEVAQLGMMVWDLTDDVPVYQHHPRYLMRTASTMKALTAVTALDCLGGDYRVRTSLYYNGEMADSTLYGQLYCVGGMDPLLDESDFMAFAQSVKTAGINKLMGPIVLDVSMKDDKMWGEGWCWDDKNPTLTPLMAGSKDLFAEHIMKALLMTGVNIDDVNTMTGQVGSDATLLTTRTHSIDELLSTMMKDSDNLFAECLYYQIAASSGKQYATAVDAQARELALFKKMGLDGRRYRLADGSGLSLYNYLSPEAETMLMRYAWQHKDIYRHLLPSLPIAGVDGTLEKRMRKTRAQGNVRAKTGTVTGVSTLTGYLTAANGHTLCFAIMMQGLRRTADGRRLQDSICVAMCE